MSSKGMSLKGRINNYAKQNGIAAQVVLQNFMFERFLETSLWSSEIQSQQMLTNKEQISMNDGSLYIP